MSALFAALLALLLSSTAAKADDESRRKEISTKGATLFKNTTNHCKSFQDLVAFAVTKVNGPGQLIEDLKFVLIGKGIRDRGTGPHYIGNTPGARGDSGFKSELQDNSPQVEHAWAAIYVGKTLPPGSAEAIALITEILGDPFNPQDALLWSLGADAGQRLSASNYKLLPDVIKRTMCK